MSESKRCLRQVQKIKDVASGKSLPYVARSRIGRLVLGLNALASKTKGERGIEVAALGGKIHSITKSICQPSEPLDARWRAGWAELISELAKLEYLLGQTALQP